MAKFTESKCNGGEGLTGERNEEFSMTNIIKFGQDKRS